MAYQPAVPYGATMPRGNEGAVTGLPAPGTPISMSGAGGVNPYSGLLGGGTGGADPTGSARGGFTGQMISVPDPNNPGSVIWQRVGGDGGPADPRTGTQVGVGGGAGGGGSISGGGGTSGTTSMAFPPQSTRQVTGGGSAPGFRDMTRTDEFQYDPFQTSVSPYRDFEKRLLQRYENFDASGLDAQIERERSQGLEQMRNELIDRGLGGRGSGLGVAAAAEFLSGFNPAAMAARSGLQLQAMGQMGSAISGFRPDTFQPVKTGATSQEKGQTGGGGGVQPSTGEQIVYNPYLNLR